MSSILVIDHDAKAAQDLSALLGRESYDAVIVADPDAAIARLVDRPVGLVLLERRFPRANAIDVLRRIRAMSDVPCIIITAAPDDVDRIVCLEIGADDYMAKTAHPLEILARIRALLRRRPMPQVAIAMAEPQPVREEAGHWRLMVEKRELFRPDGTACGLTTAEFDVLNILVQVEGRPVSRDEICRGAFRRPYRAGDRAVDMILYKLRKIIEPRPEQPEVLKSVRSLGYVFTGFPQPAHPHGAHLKLVIPAAE